MVRIVGDHIFSPLGNNTFENYNGVIEGRSGIQKIKDETLWRDEFYGAAFTQDQKHFLKSKYSNNNLSLLESVMVHSIDEALATTGVNLKDSKTLLILSTTKGNVDWLRREMDVPNRALLTTLNQNISNYFGLTKSAMLISNACVSGLMGVIVAARLIENGYYERAVVCGGDLLTKFTLSGFQSFMAVSAVPCKPFDVNRAGISLGEGVGTMVLCKSDDSDFPAYLNGASANDANHISGPSRNGEGLFLAVQRTLNGRDAKPSMISAHGTATPFNDEMECQAFNRLNLQNVPVHSLKGNFGHTLGAAGLIETIIALQAMKNGIVIPTLGFEKHGVTLPLNVSNTIEKADIKYLLKTSSGFGGGNAAALFSK